jgi:hypothetical protein
MGTFRLINQRLSVVLSWPEITEFASDVLAERSLIDAARTLDGWSDKEDAFLSTMPESMQAAIHGLLHQNFNRDQRMEVQFAWLPGYAWKLTISEDAPVRSGDHPGAITVLLESPHPDQLLSSR